MSWAERAAIASEGMRTSCSPTCKIAGEVVRTVGAGLITREVEGGPPVNVSYRLTRRGEALRPALAELERWRLMKPEAAAEQLYTPIKPRQS